MAVTRLGYEGYGVRRAGSFAGKGSAPPGGPHPVPNITRLSPDGYFTRRDGSFAGKTTTSGGGGAGAHPVGTITRLGEAGYGVRRYGANAFAGKSSGTPSGGPHPVSRVTRLGLDGYGVKRNGAFSGKSVTASIVAGYGSLLAFWTGVGAGNLPDAPSIITRARLSGLRRTISLTGEVDE